MSTENDFLVFAGGSGANVETQSTWVTDSVVPTGFQSGRANSAQANKVLRQCSIIAAMIAQFIVDNSGQPAIDNGTTATLEANLLASINAIITTFAANALGAGGTSYSPQFASVSADANDDGGNGGQFRLIYGNYGVILRNDGVNVFILLTNSGSQAGTFNSLRPFRITLATGAVAIDIGGAGTTFGGNITAPSATISGQVSAGTVSAGTLISSGNTTVDGSLTVDGSISTTSVGITGALSVGGNQTVVGTLTVSQPAYAATAATGTRSTQLATTAMFANEFGVNFSTTNGYQKLPSGLIIQWGTYTNLPGSGTLNFTLTFPNGVCIGIVSNDCGAGSSSTDHVTSCTAISGSQFNAYGRDNSGNPATTNLFWMAIGY